MKANIDVGVLVAAFNLSPSTCGRVIPVPAEQMGIDKAQAILTTKDFFVIADNLLDEAAHENAWQLDNVRPASRYGEPANTHRN